MFFILKPHSLEFTTGVDNNLLGGGARFVSTFFHFTYHVCAADDMAKDHVLVIQPVGPVKYINRVLSKLVIPSDNLYFVVHMKNCDPFVLGPELAMDNVPKLLCFKLKFSSANFLP